MKDAQKLHEFLQNYKLYVTDILQPTRNEAKILLKRWKEAGYWAKYIGKTRLPAPSPIQRAFSRIKRPESVVDKIYRKPADYPAGLSSESFRKMHDTVGARVIVYFMSQLPLIDKELRDSGDFEISPDSPPIAYLSADLTKKYSLDHLRQGEKESGCSSIHYIAKLRNSKIQIDQRPWFELQVRTLAEDVWGEVEHIIGYKPDKKTSFAVRNQFYVISKELSAIDEHFNFLYEELLRFQEEASIRDTDPLNAENLPPVLSELGIGCAQQEIYGLLKLLVSRQVKTVGALRGLATIRRMDVIRNTYRAEKGRAAANFEVVATLATLGSATSDEEEIELIKAQMAFLDAWDSLKQGFT